MKRQLLSLHPLNQFFDPIKRPTKDGPQQASTPNAARLSQPLRQPTKATKAPLLKRGDLTSFRKREADTLASELE
jgi:hypothetical protein